MAGLVPKSRVKLSFQVLSACFGSGVISYTDLKRCLQCFNLVDKDWLSKSDPIVILQERKRPEDPWAFVGRTEMIKDCLSPVFKEKIVMVNFTH